MSKSIVVLSGGQDSVTCFGMAKRDTNLIGAISFNYNQRHAVELEAAADLCKRMEVEHKVIDLGFLSDLVTSALTNDSMEVGEAHPRLQNLPASFVPCRNALFLTLAHAYAQEKGADRIYTGVCQTDFSGYPDCRASFVELLAVALNTGYESEIQIITPLMHITKGATFALAEEVGFLDEVIENSHTCYEGDHETLHEWGYGCGECPACKLRAKGWEAFQSEKEAK